MDTPFGRLQYLSRIRLDTEFAPGQPTIEPIGCPGDCPAHRRPPRRWNGGLDGPSRLSSICPVISSGGTSDILGRN